MSDGLYQVTTHAFCAGFIVAGGKVKRSQCAPILRRRLAYWMRLAVRVECAAS